MNYYVYKSTKNTSFIAVQKKAGCVLIKECKTLAEAKEAKASLDKNGDH